MKARASEVTARSGAKEKFLNWIEQSTQLQIRSYISDTGVI